VRRLAAGDFLVDDNFAVERKTLRDFAASVIDARLFKQAVAIVAGARRGVIVLEGTATSTARGSFTR
jgi:DNA excision repair protein ERCC-4